MLDLFSKMPKYVWNLRLGPRGWRLELGKQRVNLLDLKGGLWIYSGIKASRIWVLFFRYWTEMGGRCREDRGDVAQHLWGAKMTQLLVPLQTHDFYYYILSLSFRRQLENKNSKFCVLSTAGNNEEKKQTQEAFLE